MPQTPETKILNIDYLRAITGGDTSIEARFFGLFEKTYHRTVEAMKKAAIDRDMILWKSAVHELKGSAGYLGAERLNDACKSAEFITQDFETFLAIIQKNGEWLFAEIAKIRVE